MNILPARIARPVLVGLALLLLAGVGVAAEHQAESVVLVAVSASDGVAVVARGADEPVLLRQGDSVPGLPFVVSQIQADGIMVRAARGEPPMASAVVHVGSELPTSIASPFPAVQERAAAVTKSQGVPGATAPASVPEE